MNISKHQLIRLIRMDLLNLQLTNHLPGLPAECCALGINEIIFEILGLNHLPDPHLDQIMKAYAMRSRAILHLHPTIDQDKIDQLAEELYTSLIKETNLIN